MRAEIQGLVEMQAVVEPDGTVGGTRIVKSLDDQLGLDWAAACAGSQWVFRPATLDGTPVAVIVTLMLECHFH